MACHLCLRSTVVSDAIRDEQSVLDTVVKWLKNEIKYVLLWYSHFECYDRPCSLLKKDLVSPGKCGKKGMLVMGTFLNKQGSGWLERAVRWRPRKVAWVEEVNKVNIHCFLQLKKDGVLNDLFRPQNEDKQKVVLCHKILTLCCKISGMPDMSTASHIWGVWLTRDNRTSAML